MIKVHPASNNTPRWIGVDLNTTGHVAVAADIISGKIIKLGKNIHFSHHQSSKKCTTFWKEGKLWKLKKRKSRERKTFKSALNAISRQIVSFAESLGSGIKFEKLFSPRYSHRHDAGGSFEFSFDNGSFFSLQRQVERRAVNHGIQVMYVNPANTSKRCSRCGCLGRRSRKHFECPHCGFIAHADVNAAFNIAAAPLREISGKYQVHSRVRPAPSERKALPRQYLTESNIHHSVQPLVDLNLPENILAVLE